jgi:hypothetical protein
MIVAGSLAAPRSGGLGRGRGRAHSCVKGALTPLVAGSLCYHRAPAYRDVVRTTRVPTAHSAWTGGN